MHRNQYLIKRLWFDTISSKNVIHNQVCCKHLRYAIKMSFCLLSTQLNCLDKFSNGMMGLQHVNSYRLSYLLECRNVCIVSFTMPFQDNPRNRSQAFHQYVDLSMVFDAFADWHDWNIHILVQLHACNMRSSRSGYANNV